MCYYEPEESDKKIFKFFCTQLVELIKNLEETGDPLGCSIQDAHTLIDHLYDPSKCKERKKR